MPIQKLRQFLDENLVKYIVITHSKAYTSQGIAASAHISGNELAKTVMLKKDGELCMAVLPASRTGKSCSRSPNSPTVETFLSPASASSRIAFRIARSEPCRRSETSTASASIADTSLTRDKEIAFNAGSHLELIQLAYSDFERLVEPTIADFATRSTSRAA